MFFLVGALKGMYKGILIWSVGSTNVLIVVFILVPEKN